MSTFNFGFDPTGLQMNNSNIAAPGFNHHPPSNLDLVGTSGCLYSPLTGVNRAGVDDFHAPAPTSTPNPGLNMEQRFSGASSRLDIGSAATASTASTLEGQELAELLKMVSNLVKQNGDLHQQNNSLQTQINALSMEFQLLQKQNAHDSRMFVDGVRSASITPHDSVSQITPTRFQPTIRPEQYPESILWSLKDAQDAQLVTESNKSRPPMEKCIRNEDGSQISAAQWRAIKLTARTVAQTELLSLPIPSQANSVPRTKVYYKQNHAKAWFKAIHELEIRQPLLFLCEGNWKADHVLGATLLASVSEAKQKLKRKSRASSATIDNTDLSDKEEREDSTRKDEADTPQPQNIDNSSDAEIFRDRAAKRRKVQNSSSNAPKKTKKLLTPRQDQPSLLSGSRPVSTTASTPTNAVGQQGKIDISFIYVEPSCSSLKNELFESFPSIPFAKDLLDAMGTQLNLETGPASESVTAFLSRIDNADPNSTDYSEDDSNSCWGHSQFCSGGMTCSSILTSWHDVGSVKMACKLIAAAIKTCKVARHVCSYRGIDSASYLSDAYLQNLIEKLWDLWKSKGQTGQDKPQPECSTGSQFRFISNLSQRSAPAAPAESQSLTTSLTNTDTVNGSMPLEGSQTPDQSQLRNALQLLQKEELKQWLTLHKVVVPSKNKQRTKDDIISAIFIYSPTKPSMDDIKFILEARKSKKTKSTVSTVSTSTTTQALQT